MVEQAVARPGVARARAARLRGMHALTLAVLGRLDDAAGAADKALAGAEAAGDRFAAGYALHAQAQVSLLRSEFAGRLGLIDRALAVIGDDPQAADLRLVLLSHKAGAPAETRRPAHARAAPRQAPG